MRATVIAGFAALLLLSTGCAGGEERPTVREPTGRTSGEPTTAAPTSPPPASGTVVAGSPARLSAQLIEAAWANDVPTARRLIARGADVNAKDDTEQSAYLIATSEGYLRLLDLTLRHGASVRSLDSYRGTGLIRAAERGHADVVGRLLQTRIDVDHVNRLGWTALHEAIVLGDGSQRYVDTVRLLVAGGADLRLASQRGGRTPLQLASAAGQERVAAVLRSALRTSRPRDADAALLRAAVSGDADRAARALRAGARLEVRDSRGRTPLLLAATHDRVAVARLLVFLGADPDALDDQNDTPWLVTGVTGSVAMAEVLLAADPDLTITNRFGGTSLIPASERGHLAYVRRVVQTGIDVNHVNDLGWTALLEAVILGDGSRVYREIVRTLLDAGADPSIPDSNGVTALEHARERGHTAMLRVLSRSPARE